MNRIVLLGTGCPAPSHIRFGPSTLVQINKKNYLFDVGSGVTQRLNKLGLKSSDIDEVFITHMHSDHIVDLYQLYIRRHPRTSWPAGDTPAHRASTLRGTE